MDYRQALRRPHYALRRWMYRDGRPGLLARAMNRLSALQFSAGVLSPRRAVTLEVRGRRSGRLVSLPLVAVEVGAERYLVSMLGNDANWVRATSAPRAGALCCAGVGEPMCTSWRSNRPSGPRSCASTSRWPPARERTSR